MKPTPQISDAEWRVMRVLWEQAPLTATEVVDALAGVQEWHPRTIKTLLSRLVSKGALKYREQGRAYLYEPAVPEAECIRAESRSFLSRVFGGAFSPLLVQFIEETPLTPQEIEELRQLLDRKRRQK